jgi:predicted  nucleic acid-binding Zn ribbon protein
MWKKKNQNSRSSPSYLWLFLIISGLILGQSCNISVDNSMDHSINERNPTIELQASPEKWKSSDTVYLSIKCGYKNDEAIEGMRGLSVPGAEIVSHIEQENDDHTYLGILFFPGQSYYDRTENKFALCKCEWELPEKDVILSLQDRFLIRQDDAGFYYFQRDENFYRLDTLYPE